MKPFSIRSARFVRFALLPSLFSLLSASGASAADAPTGEQIYLQKCVKCHGPKGEGGKDVDSKPLLGDLPVKELAKVIAETMPQDDPESCTGEEAEKVAAYVYDAFYSKAAQARLHPPRIELARLTVRQYRNVLADLLSAWEPPLLNGDRGLQGEYFNAKHFRGDKRVLERRDPTVDFQFGEASPLPDKIEANEFSLRWNGSLIAPETGEYEFVIKTHNGARLWLNDPATALIDAWVKSGSDTEYRQSIQLLGGRAYPLRLEFFKTKEAKDKTASISLLWKPPHGVLEPIPERHLSPQRVPETLVITTPFPPDDRSTGFERGASVSKAWDQAATYSAVEVAGYVVKNLSRLAKTKDDAPDRAQQAREFCRQFVERAFRRPLNDEQRAFFVDRHFDAAADLNLAVKKSLLLTLKSPRFLYHEAAGGGGDAFDVASRMSLALWDSLPDRQLREAAARGQLQTRDQVIRQAERMLNDMRTQAKLRDFFHQWLRVDRADDLSKDRSLYPDFDEQVASDLRVSLDLFLDDVVWNSEGADFRQLLQADFLFLNGRLAPLYGGNLPAGAPFQKVAVDPQQRSGLLSHPFLLASFAYRADSSPIHRGVFLFRGLLGRALRPPPEAVAPLSPDLHADLTTRERVTLQTSAASCQSCHEMLNPLGFSLEHYDAAGRYRTEERGKPIDDLGFYQTLSGQRVEFRGARELGAFLAGSEEVHSAFVEQLFHYFVKQPIRAYGADQPEPLRRAFADSGYNIRRLLIELTAASALPPSKSE